MHKAEAPRVITVDIETAPYEVYAWRLWDTSISNDQIKQDATILACAIKELGKPKVHYMDVFGKKNLRDDVDLIKWILGWLDSADVVVTQNGKRFDIRRINARAIVHKLNPPKPFLQVDTREQAKKIAEFASNKLEWLAALLTDEVKDKHRQFPGNELWHECLKRNRKAWAEMRKYNPQDVIATEKVYLRLRPWMPNHPNMAVIADKPEHCRACVSSKLQSRGWAYTDSYRYRRFQCTACGAWNRAKKREKV